MEYSRPAAYCNRALGSQGYPDFFGVSMNAVLLMIHSTGAWTHLYVATQHLHFFAVHLLKTSLELADQSLQGRSV